ncbi:MAG: DUF2807 domain-containing protein [Gaiellales bacterium]|nr:DUF2807 domain-containing protein [Gaiellales bacterium]
MRTGVVAAVVVVSAVLVGAVAGVGTGCGRPAAAGPLMKEERPLDTFTEVEVSGAGTLILTQGAAVSLSIEAPQEVLRDLDTKVEGGVLKMGPRSDRPTVHPWPGKEDITYHLSVRDLSRVDLRGATDVRSKNTLTPARLEISGAGSHDVNLQVESGALRLDMQGSGRVTVAGTSDTLHFVSKGSARLHATGLSCRAASIDCNGSSRVEIGDSQELAVRIAGNAEVSYTGDPMLSTAIYGSGKVTRSTP